MGIVQLRNPRSGKYVKVDTGKARILASGEKPFARVKIITIQEMKAQDPRGAEEGCSPRGLHRKSLKVRFG